MKSLRQKVEDVCRIEKIEGKFSGNFRVQEISGVKNYSGETSLKTKNVKIGYNPDVVRKKSENVLLNVVSDVSAHEINHHKYEGCVGCPQTIDKHVENFFNPVYSELIDKGFNCQDVEYICNALQDTILHEGLHEGVGKKLEGIVSFFEDQIEGDNLTDFYEAHVKFNLDMWGESSQYKKLSGFFKNSEIVSEVLTGFYSDLNNGNFVEEISIHKKSFKKINGEVVGEKYGNFEKIKKFDKNGIAKYLLDENNWKEIATLYTKHFSKIMEKGYALPLFNVSGAGTNGREIDKKGEEEGGCFDKERRSRNFKKGEVLRGSKSGKVPEWIDKYEALDLLYEGSVEELEIKAESFVNPESFPVFHYGDRKFDHERDDFRNVHFGVGDSLDIELKKREHPYEIPIDVKTSPRSFPKVKFGMIDVSVSMQEDLFGGGNIGNTSIIPWGDNSKYHWALMAQFGIFEYFKKNHLLNQDSISICTFGSNTVVVDGYKNVKKRLLSPSFEGSTNINTGSLNKFFEGEENLIYTIGDGEIQNWNSIRDNFLEMAQRHIYFHLHMGENCQMIEDLREKNIPIIQAQDGKGIVDSVINLTDRVIRNY